MKWLSPVFALTPAMLIAALSFSQSSPERSSTMSLQVSTTSFPAGGTIPKRFTCSAEDVSPALTWTGVPPTTQSLALIVDDPDAPAGTWTHWLVYNLPASVHELAENQPRSEQLPMVLFRVGTIFAKLATTDPALRRASHTDIFSVFLPSMPNLISSPAPIVNPSTRRCKATSSRKAR